MSINHLIHAEMNPKYNIYASHTNTEKLSLKLNEVDTIDFHSLGSVGVPGTSIISDGKGNLEWSNSIAAAQKDIFLNKNPILIEWKHDEWTEIVLPLHRDGSFQFIEVDQLVHIHMCFYYKYIGANGHLPFRIKVMKNDEEVYNEHWGEFDKYDALNKILDHLVVDANIGDSIKFYIKKEFNDPGNFELQQHSYITYEVL
jgi:hypothetical protein